jgi:hypothetical protein
MAKFRKRSVVIEAEQVAKPGENLAARFSWTCPKCGLNLVSGSSFNSLAFMGCPACERQALVEHVVAGGSTRFPVNLSKDERAYVDGRIKP